jgi:ribosomal protein L14E/L6E/L27E
MVELKPGQLVRSLAGRDHGKHYLVLREIDQRNVLLVDGRSRPLAKPKKKNKAHLQHYDRIADLGEPVSAEILSDSQVIWLIKEMIAPPVSGTPDKEV